MEICVTNDKFSDNVFVLLHRVDWDLPLHCLPGSDIRFGDDLRSSQTTLRDVLSHRVGLPGYLWTLLTGVPENVTRADMVR